MAKTWNVSLPFTGYVVVEVEAENEREAIEAALNGEVTTDDIEQWEVVKEIVQGNVFFGMRNRAEAEPVDDE